MIDLSNRIQKIYILLERNRSATSQSYPKSGNRTYSHFWNRVYVYNVIVIA